MIVFLAAVVAVCGLTWVVGWWGVVVAALVVGAMWNRRPAIAWIVALAAIAGWGVLLLVNAVSGRFGALAEAVSGVMRIPAGVLVIATLLFAGLLGWSAAVVGGELAHGAASFSSRRSRGQHR
jgi:hypothetical protein